MFSTFEMDALQAMSRDCLATQTLASLSTEKPKHLHLTELKHVRSFNDSEKTTLEHEMANLLNALSTAQQSYLALAMAHIDAEQRVWEGFEQAWSNHLTQMTRAMQLPLQREPLSRARG